MEDERAVIDELQARLADVAPLPNEPHFHQDKNVLRRFLIARDWKVDKSEKMLRKAIEWRRTFEPLSADCKWCHSMPGYHSVRQVGHDLLGRPVIYACFKQQYRHKDMVQVGENVIWHIVYAIENAKITMGSHAESQQFVFVLDCKGISMNQCSPSMGVEIMKLLSDCYPERLGLFICVNHNTVFQAIWLAVKPMLNERTAHKLVLLSGRDHIKTDFCKRFPQHLTDWLMMEIERNKNERKDKQIRAAQSQFWLPPMDPMQHDPRGSQQYICNWIEPYTDGAGQHKPHPNICDVAHLFAKQKPDCLTNGTAV